MLKVSLQSASQHTAAAAFYSVCQLVIYFWISWSIKVGMRSRFVELSQGRRPQLTVVGISGGGFRWLTITWKRSIWMGAAAVVTIWAAGRGQKVATAVWDLPVRSSRRAWKPWFGSNWWCGARTLHIFAGSIVEFIEGNGALGRSF